MRRLIARIVMTAVLFSVLAASVVVAAADAVLKALPDWTSRTVDGYTLVVPTSSTDHNRIAIYPDVMIIYSWSDDVGPQQVPVQTPNVTENPYYTTALERLPDSNYDM